MSYHELDILRLLAVGLAIALAGCSDDPAMQTAPPSVVLITLDTTRVDHLSTYGYERETSPNLDAFAERAVRYRRAWSTSSWTLPAHGSLFTGVYPSRHGAHYADDGAAVLSSVLDIPLARYVRAGRLPEEQVTMAEILGAQGYSTAAFVAGPWLNRGFGLLQGFTIKDDDVKHFGGRPADEITNRALGWLAGLPEGEPYFLFVNFFDAHAPYEPKQVHPDFPKAQMPFEPDYDSVMNGKTLLTQEERAILTDRYDAEIREMDAELGRLLEAVMARADGDETLVIVTADHGEALGDDGRFGHGFWLTEDLIRIPLIVRFPHDRHAGTWNDQTMQLVDVLPLVAAELHLTLPEQIAGVEPGSRKVAIAELYRESTTVVRYGRGYDRDFQVVIDWPHKLERLGDAHTVLSRLRDGDLQEVPDDSAEGVRERLSSVLEAHVSSAPDQELVRPEVSAETVEALRRLGYVE